MYRLSIILCLLLLLASNPAAGDTFTAWPGCAAQTNDGVHPTVNSDFNSHQCTNDECGGIYVLDYAVQPTFTSWK